MSNVLRSTTFQLEFNGADGVRGIRQFVKTVGDADAVVERLSQSLGENVKVSASQAKSAKELTAEARRVANEMARNERNTERLTEQYRNMAKAVGMTDDQLQVHNAVIQLGSNATEEQRRQVEQSVMAYQKLRDANIQTQGSFRNARGTMQNFGWQLQDTIVQLQMGTSAFTVFSQQGSQMAAAFGPTGAVVGAVIALAGVVGGTLFTSLFNTKKASDELAKSTENIAKVFSVTKNSTIELTEEFRKLYKVDRDLAELRLKVALLDAEKAMRTAKKGIAEAFNEIGVAWYNLTVNDLVAGGKGLDYIYNLTESITGLEKGAEGFFKASNQVRWFIKQVDQLKEGKGSVDEFGTALRNIEKIAKPGNDKLTDFLRTSLDLVVKFEEGKITVDKLREALANLDTTVVETSDSFIKNKGTSDQFIANLAYEAATLGMTSRALREYQINLMSIPEADKEVLRGLNDRIALYGIEAAMEKHFADLADKTTDSLSRQYNAREAIRRQIENAQVRQFKKDDPVQGEIEQFERNLLVLAEQKRQTDALGYEGLAERQRIDGLIEAEVNRHNAAMELANLQSMQNSIGSLSMGVSMASGIVDMMTNGVQQIKNQTAEMNAFQKTMFLVTQTIAAAQAIINGIDIGMKLAAAFPLAAPAMIALGTGLGAAQAGVIMGTTFAGTFDNGGYIPAGSTGIMSEYGTEIANGALVQGPAQITSREDTAALLAGSGGGGYNLTIENRIPSGNYSVVKDGDNSMKIIAEQVFNKNIDGGVANVLGSSNSKSAKSLRSNYQVRRNLGGN
jgi:hypothetical protein